MPIHLRLHLVSHQNLKFATDVHRGYPEAVPSLATALAAQGDCLGHEDHRFAEPTPEPGRTHSFESIEPLRYSILRL